LEIRENRLWFGEHSAGELTERFGSPLFVYEEECLRTRCKELKGLLKRQNFQVNYSCKANSSVALLKIVREERLRVDAMSPGEIFLEMEAGFTSEEILFIPNNVSKDEMSYAIERKIRTSVDSLAQLEYYGQLNPGGQVFVRVNPGIGDGHHKKVITAGKAKFGIPPYDLDKAKEIARRYDLSIVGLNMHIGSLFLKPDNYLSAITGMLEIAQQFEHLKYIDFGGGIGIPYRKSVEERFEMEAFGSKLDALLDDWEERTGRHDIMFLIEPGRYPVAECCTILTTVHSIKENFGAKYIGTDLGLNLLIRPALYGSYHEIIVCDNVEGSETETVNVCGNICESGDLVAEGRVLPRIELGDELAVLDAGAYGFAMSSNYNARLRPAEVLIAPTGEVRIIREREDYQYLLLNQRY
jgi:diaminopimelate decarboxylase